MLKRNSRVLLLGMITMIASSVSKNILSYPTGIMGVQQVKDAPVGGKNSSSTNSNTSNI